MDDAPESNLMEIQIETADSRINEYRIFIDVFCSQSDITWMNVHVMSHLGNRARHTYTIYRGSRKKSTRGRQVRRE